MTQIMTQAMTRATQATQEFITKLESLLEEYRAIKRVSPHGHLRVFSPLYTAASRALREAHKACLKHPNRKVLGMSSGPFSGTNVVLGIIADLEDLLIQERICFQRTQSELVDALEEMTENFKPFTSKSVGAPNSQARLEQESQFEAHTKACAILAKVK